MIDFSNIEQYRENNRIEAKRALGGLPRSIWETYSAFANTLGGVILLGVEEHKDKSLHPVNLPDPEKLIREFWRILNHPKYISANILTNDDVSIEEIGGKRIIAVRVPRATEGERPIYIGDDPFTGSYLRNGEGDYRCTRDEVYTMQRTARLFNAGRTPSHPRSIPNGKHRSDRARKRAIIAYLTSHVYADENALARSAGTSVAHMKPSLRELLADDILVYEHGTYRLKR